MKRWLSAVAVLLGGAVVGVHADYVVIRLNLANTKDKEQNQAAPGFGVPGMPGMAPGGMPMMPGMGMGGGGKGAGGGGAPNMPGMPGGVPSMPSMPGGGLQMPGGGRGVGGGLPGGAPQIPGRGAGGGLGGIQGAAPPMMPGMPGMPGGGMPGAMPGGRGMGGGMPGAMPGGPPMMPGGGGMRGQPGAMPGMMPGNMRGGQPANALNMGRLMTFRIDEEPESAPLFVGGIIEAKKSDIQINPTTGRMHLKTRWGETSIYFGPEIEVTRYRMPTVRERYDEKVKKLSTDSSERTANLLELADWCLAHGLLAEVPKVMADLAKIDPKHRSVVAFQNIEKAIGREVSQDDPALKWKDKFGDFKEEKSKHYTLVYDVQTIAEARQRLQRLEENYTGFFYWFAVRGHELPVPQKRLVAVLLKTPESFKQKHTEVFDAVPLVADGLFARRENLAVFSSERLDDEFGALRKQVKDELLKRNWSEEELLAGKGRRTNLAPNELPYAQTLTLVYRSMQDTAERFTVGYEGTRQLIAACNLLPRSVEVPQWIDFGVASFFDTSKDMAFWPGIGTVNLPYLLNFKLWDETKKLDKNPANALKSVVTDALFHRAATSKSKELALNKARTLSWTLVYYLAQKRRGGLLNYYQQLANLPRDLEFDDSTLLLVFARAFGLVDPAKPDEVDANALARLASEWYQYTRLVTVEIEEVRQEYMEKNQKKKPDKTTTAVPARPAGGY